MSNISSNSLFHFTPKAEYLIGILRNNFIPRFCYEEITIVQDNKPIKLEGAYPMICFCDISLGQISKHISSYGSYGIGMSKEWALKNKLNPIIYLNQESSISEIFNQIIKEISGGLKSIFNNKLDINVIVKEFENLEVDNKLDKSFKEITNAIKLVLNSIERTNELANNMMKLSKYYKQYQGDLIRGNKTIKDVKFYDEREWRYIPDISILSKETTKLEKKDFENNIKLAQENTKLEKFKLEFKPNDIKYVFVKSENEIPAIINALREIKSEKYKKTEIDILISKILTTDQILEDF